MAHCSDQLDLLEWRPLSLLGFMGHSGRDKRTHKWLYAMYLLVTARKGISSMQIAKEIGVQQKSAWFMLHRLREHALNKLRKKAPVSVSFLQALARDVETARAGRVPLYGGGEEEDVA